MPFGVLQPERIVTNVKGRIVMKKTVREILMRISLFPSLAHMGLYQQIYIPELGSLSRIFGNPGTQYLIGVRYGGRWFLECIVIDIYGRCAVYA